MRTRRRSGINIFLTVFRGLIQFNINSFSLHTLSLYLGVKACERKFCLNLLVFEIQLNERTSEFLLFSI